MVTAFFHLEKGEGGDFPAQLIMEKEAMARELYDALVLQMEAQSVMGQHYICVLDNHILERTRSVVLIAQSAADCYLLKFCCPLARSEYERLAALDYIPVLRGKHYLTVGLDRSQSYAYSAVRVPLYGSVVDWLCALGVLGRELERLLKEGCVE